GTSFGSRPRPSANATTRAKNSAAGPNRSNRDHPFRRTAADTSEYSAFNAASVSGTAMSLEGRINLERAALDDLIDRQSLRLIAGHPGSAGRHPRERDADDLRLFRKQPVDDFHRNVAADDVTGHQRQVARLEAIRNAVFLAHYRQIVGRDDLYREA